MLLEHQDRSLWDRQAIAQAACLLERAAPYGDPGLYQLQAAIAAVHCEAASSQDTDWPQILSIYTLLAALDPSPVVRLNRAIALRYVAGSAEALKVTEFLALVDDGYHDFWARNAPAEPTRG